MTDTSPTSNLSDERLEILRLVENQTISAEEAGRLLEALDRSDRADRFQANQQRTMPMPPSPPGAPEAPVKPGSVRIRITDLKTNKAQVNLVLPNRLVDSGIKMAKRLAPEHMLDSREIRRSIEEGYWGPLLDITDNDKRVEIIVEGVDPQSSAGTTIRETEA